MSDGERRRSTPGGLSAAELFSPSRNPFLLQEIRLQLRRRPGLVLLTAAAPALLALLLVGWWWDLRSALPSSRLGWAPPRGAVDFLWLLNIVPLGTWASGLGNMQVYREYVQETLPFLRTCPWTPLEWTLKRSVFPVLFLLLLALAGLPAYLALAALGSLPVDAAPRLALLGGLSAVALYVLFLTQSPWVSDAMRRPWLQQGREAPGGRTRQLGGVGAPGQTSQPREAEYGATAGWGIGWVILLGVVALTVLSTAFGSAFRGPRLRRSLLDAMLTAAAGPLPFFDGEVSGALLLGGLAALVGIASFALAVQVADPDRLHVGTRRFSLLVGGLGWVVGAGLLWVRLGPLATVAAAFLVGLVVAIPTLYLRWLRRPRGAGAIRSGASRRGGRSYAAVARALPNPVLRFDLLYRQRGYSLAFPFLCGMVIPSIVALSAAGPRVGGGTPFPLFILGLSLPVLALALVVPWFGARLWAADWERRTVDALLATPLADGEIIDGRRRAAWVIGLMPILGIGASGFLCALALGIGYGLWSALAIVTAIAAWVLSAVWLQSTAVVDPLPASTLARYLAAAPLALVLLLPFPEFAVLCVLAASGDGRPEPWAAYLNRRVPVVWAATLLLMLLNLLLARLIFAWQVRRLHRLRSDLGYRG